MTRRVLTVLRAAVNPAVTWRVIGDLYSTEMPAKLEWRHGALQGTPDAMKDVDEFLTTGRQIALLPTGPYLDADKHDELSAFALALSLMRNVDVTGNPPELPSIAIPPDAIA